MERVPLRPMTDPPVRCPELWGCGGLRRGVIRGETRRQERAYSALALTGGRAGGRRGYLSDYLLDESIDIHPAALAEGRHPHVELRSPHEDLPANPVAQKRMSNVGEIRPELANAETAVARQSGQGKVRVERDFHLDTLDHVQSLPDACPSRLGSLPPVPHDMEIWQERCRPQRRRVTPRRARRQNNAPLLGPLKRRAELRFTCGLATNASVSERRHHPPS